MRRFLLVLLAAGLACNSAPKVLPGDIDATWRGSDRGRFIAPLSAVHCVESGIVELLAIRGDTGVGAALFLKDSTIIEPTAYPVVPGSQLDEPRPGATAGIRWFATTAINAWEGATGSVTLELTGRVLKGTIDAKFQALDKPDSLRLNASFADVPVTVADSGCGRIRKRYKV